MSKSSERKFIADRTLSAMKRFTEDLKDGNLSEYRVTRVRVSDDGSVTREVIQEGHRSEAISVAG